LVKIKARNLAGDKAVLLDELLDLKEWTMEKVLSILGNKIENNNDNPWVDGDKLRLWNPHDRT